MNILSSRTITRGNIIEFIKGLSPDERFNSLYLEAGLSTRKMEKAVELLSPYTKADEKIMETACHSKTGAVIFLSNKNYYTILPPFPIRETDISEKLNTVPLLSLLQTNYKIGLVLVRLGSYAVGVCRGEELISSKVGTGLVHGRHKKGGSSAHRFERHRDKQIEYFLTRVCQRTREQLEGHVKSLDYLVFGGARTTVQLLQKQCSFIGKLETDTLPPLFDIPEPRQAVLEKAVIRIWSSTIIKWGED